MRKFAFVLFITAMMSVSASAQAKSGVEGVWQLSEMSGTGPDGKVETEKATQPSMYLFTKNHYSIIYVASDKPRMVMEDFNKATKEDLIATFVKQFVANAGTYDVKADKLTFHPMVAKSPGYMKEGTWSTMSMKVSGNTLTLISHSSNSGPSKNPATVKLTRIE
jgi:hypothetical protein